jgi:hypothetical protein
MSMRGNLGEDLWDDRHKRRGFKSGNVRGGGGRRRKKEGTMLSYLSRTIWKFIFDLNSSICASSGQ